MDFDRIMHENFQYENTMNRAHLNKFNRNTGDLMFSRAAMKHFHELQQEEYKFMKQHSQFNLAGGARDGPTDIDAQPKVNKVLHDGYVNVGQDMVDEAYQTYEN